MKNILKHAIVAATLVTSLGVIAPSVAFASGTSSGATATTSAWKTFKTEWATYGQGLQSINVTYRAAEQSAHATFNAAMSGVTTLPTREAARTALWTAIEAAMSARVTAIIGAGNPPTPPAGYNGSAWVASFQAANIAFRASVVAAQQAFVVAMSSATTQSEHAAAHAALKLAVGNAYVTRSAALTALGERPAKPGHLAS